MAFKNWLLGCPSVAKLCFATNWPVMACTSLAEGGGGITPVAWQCRGPFSSFIKVSKKPGIRTLKSANSSFLPLRAPRLKTALFSAVLGSQLLAVAGNSGEGLPCQCLLMVPGRGGLTVTNHRLGCTPFYKSVRLSATETADWGQHSRRV